MPFEVFTFGGSFPAKSVCSLFAQHHQRHAAKCWILGWEKKEFLQQNPTHALMFNEEMEMDAAAMEADEEGM